MYDSRPSRPRSRIAWGVLATGNSRRVALLTPTSVAWADSSTAVSSSNTLVYSSSVLGRGLAALRVAKKGTICAVCMGWTRGKPPLSAKTRDSGAAARAQGRARRAKWRLGSRP
ncbi:hypothetical protein D3C78_1548310 [compost metagenome]